MGSFLDKPVVEHHNTAPPDANGLSAAMACMQGWRVDMEDAHTLEMSVEGRPQFSFFGVFDGHGGKLVAENSAKLNGLLAKIKAAPSWPLAEKDTEALKAAMIHGFIEQDKELREGQSMPNNEDHSGSTAVTAFVTPTHIVVANCGDSRALLVGSDGSALFASEDHKPYSDEEKRRIEGAGGTVSMKRVNGDLAVSRALGDFVYKQNKPDGSTLAPPDNQQVSCIPEVTIIERRADMAFLLLCCDGIWDVMTNEQVARLVVEWTARGEVFSAQDIAGKLIDKGLEDQSKDNMSAIVVQLPDGPRFQEKRGGAGAEAAAYAGAGGGGSSSGSSSAGGGSAAAALQAQQPSGNPSSYPGTGFSSAMHDPSSLSPSPLASAQ